MKMDFISEIDSRSIRSAMVGRYLRSVIHTLRTTPMTTSPGDPGRYCLSSCSSRQLADTASNNLRRSLRLYNRPCRGNAYRTDKCVQSHGLLLVQSFVAFPVLRQRGIHAGWQLHATHAEAPPSQARCQSYVVVFPPPLFSSRFLKHAKVNQIALALQKMCF